METFVYVDKDGAKYAVYHSNPASKSWQHPYDESKDCLVCQGLSTAAPPERSTT